MTPKELIKEIVSTEGPCSRLCSYCPEQNSLTEIKEVVEGLIKKIYALEYEKEALEKRLTELKKEMGLSEYDY